MGFGKSLTAASLLALSGALTLCGGAARAADLAPLPAPPLPPPVEFTGNWYIRGDVGVASYSTGQWTQPVTLNRGEQLLNSGFLSRSIQEPAFIDAGIGYQFNQWIRADVTAEYRTAIGLRGVFQESIFNPFVPFAFFGQNEFPGTLQSTLVMANAYADLGTWYGLTPYVGGGVGVVRHNMSGFTDSGFAFTGTSFNGGVFPVGGGLSPVVDSPITDKTKTNFAWAAMAGLSYNITPNLKLDLGYRYMNLGTVESGIIHCLCGQTFQGFKVKDLTSNEFRIGMRWLFGEIGPVALAAPPAPEYVPEQPIVRKY